MIRLIFSLFNVTQARVDSLRSEQPQTTGINISEAFVFLSKTTTMGNTENPDINFRYKKGKVKSLAEILPRSTGHSHINSLYFILFRYEKLEHLKETT
ncbi:hypothetical protein Ahia01_000073500 [Argonauta hians]